MFDVAGFVRTGQGSAGYGIDLPMVSVPDMVWVEATSMTIVSALAI
ncbi:hypothetical protein [Roseimaritima ulvae]|nr:hypothetical protein [Roseimaritima ulvae]